MRELENALKREGGVAMCEREGGVAIWTSIKKPFTYFECREED